MQDEFLLRTSVTVPLPAAGLFSSSRLRGMQGARVYARRKIRTRPGSVALAVAVQRRKNSQGITVSLSVEPEATRSIETTNLSFHFLPRLFFPKYHHRSFQRFMCFPQRLPHALLMHVR